MLHWQLNSMGQQMDWGHFATTSTEAQNFSVQDKTIRVSEDKVFQINISHREWPLFNNRDRLCVCAGQWQISLRTTPMHKNTNRKKGQKMKKVTGLIRTDRKSLCPFNSSSSPSSVSSSVLQPSPTRYAADELRGSNSPCPHIVSVPMPSSV